MIIENILSKEQYNNLFNLVSGVEFPWYYQPDIAFRGDHSPDPNAFPSSGFTHIIWDADHGKVSEAIEVVEPIVANFQALSNTKINNFLRIKINLQTPIIGYTEDKHNGAHIDRFDPHKTIIYYLNDSDGDSVIFDKAYDPLKESTWPPNVDLKIKEKITPVANSLCYLENGFTYHSGSNPINSPRRITININFN